MKRRVLFLCTGNYYRSRFAEALFAAWGPSEWQASSRGLWQGENRNPGPLSRYTREALHRLRVVYGDAERYPLAVQEHDFLEATRIIALEDAEHRPMIESRFPQHLDRVEFWSIPDIPRWEPERALAAIEERVRESLVDW